jgi:hypothetical protein
MKSVEEKSNFLLLMFLWGESGPEADSLLLPLVFTLTKEMKGGEKAIVSDEEEIEDDELAVFSLNDDADEVIVSSEGFVIFVNDDDDGFIILL